MRSKNIRELENLIERLVAVSDKEWITDEDLPCELHVAQLDTSGPAAEKPAGPRRFNVRTQLHHPSASKIRLNVTGTSAPSVSC